MQNLPTARRLYLALPLSGAAQRERTTAIALEEVVNADLHQRAAAAPRELVR